MGSRKVALVRRRQVARRLRAAREAAGLSLEEAADRLDFSSSKLSRIENAYQAVDVHWVRGMMDLYGIAGDDWTELLDLTRAARARGWWRNYGPDRGYIPLEDEATLIRTFQVGVVPGLLQTREYARAVFNAASRRRTDTELENVVEVRTIRQRRLVAHPALELAAILEESALHRLVGGPDVMHAQLDRLAQVAADLPNVTLQVMPFAAGAHPAMEGSFSWLSFDGLGEPDVVYVEHCWDSTLVEKPDDVANAALIFEKLRSEALSPAASVELIEQIAHRLGDQRESHAAARLRWAR